MEAIVELNVENCLDFESETGLDSVEPMKLRLCTVLDGIGDVLPILMVLLIADVKPRRTKG